MAPTEAAVRINWHNVLKTLGKWLAGSKSSTFFFIIENGIKRVYEQLLVIVII